MGSMDAVVLGNAPKTRSSNTAVVQCKSFIPLVEQAIVGSVDSHLYNWSGRHSVYVLFSSS